MAIDCDKLINYDIPACEQTYAECDVMLYALGLGLGADPVDRATTTRRGLMECRRGFRRRRFRARRFAPRCGAAALTERRYFVRAS